MARKKTSAEIGPDVGKLTLKEIDSEIAKLQQQAALIRDREKAEVIGRIKDAIGYYGITSEDLGFGAKARNVRAAVEKVAKAKAPAPAGPAEPRPRGRVKYQDGAGNTWSGFGPKPKWFAQALAEGRAEADLLA